MAQADEGAGHRCGGPTTPSPQPSVLSQPFCVTLLRRSQRGIRSDLVDSQDQIVLLKCDLHRLFLRDIGQNATGLSFIKFSVR